MYWPFTLRLQRSPHVALLAVGAEVAFTYSPGGSLMQSTPPPTVSPAQADSPPMELSLGRTAV